MTESLVHIYDSANATEYPALELIAVHKAIDGK
jgi:hypothetical protein